MEGFRGRYDWGTASMTFIKDFINVLSASSISFLFLSSVFAFIVYFNLLDGQLRSRAGKFFLGLGMAFILIGIFIRPLLYLGVAYLAIMFGLAHLGPRLWDRKVGKWLLIFGLGGFLISMLDPNFFLIAAKPDNVPIGAMIFLLGIFSWIALRKAYLNDKQIVAGGLPWEKKENKQKTFLWAHLVFTQKVLLIFLTIPLVAWSSSLPAAP